MYTSGLFSLKNFRRIIATVYIALFGFAFIDFSSTLSPSFIKSLLYVQFAPSLIQFLKFGGIAATGFIIVILLTLLFGRIYCSALCPLGIFQDFISRIRLKSPRFKYFKPWNWIRYSLLAVVTGFAISGWLFLLNLVEPYSIAGRIFSDLVRPVYFWLNNFGVKALGLFNSYALHQVTFVGMPLSSLLITGSITIIVIVLAWRFGRIFCNSICPVGAILSIASRYSIFKLVINESACTSCKRCARDCKASCINIESKSIDFSRCVACYNCIGSCKEGGIGYKLTWQAKPKQQEEIIVDESRRKFFITAIGIASASYLLKPLSALAQNSSSNNSQPEEISRAGKRKNSRKAPITPPGSSNFPSFTKACTACHLCVSVCPTHVLQPSVKEYGLWGIMQPHMDFRSGFCNYECTRCGNVCPTGAIQPLVLETKKQTQLGIARFHRGNCIVQVDGTECGACSEHCPTKAVHMVPHRGLYFPEVRDELCIGCGACEYACPTSPYKAIYVNGNIEHGVAKLPEAIEEGPRKSSLEEFPF